MDGLTGFKPDFIIVAVKGSATEETAKQIVPFVTHGVPPVVVSLQNGLLNPSILRKVLGDKAIVCPGMFSFNVVELGTEGKPGTSSTHFLQATIGPIYLQDIPEAQPLVKAMVDAKLDTHASVSISNVQYGKLVMNLNNAVNALSGLPLKQQLSQRSYRRVTSYAISEALAVYNSAGITPVSPSPLPSWILPWALAAPDWLFLRVAKTTLAIDERAYSSMYDDLRLGRPTTEIDALNGEIVRLGNETKVPTPVNARLTELIKQTLAEKQANSWKTWTGDELLDEVLKKAA